MKKVFLFTVLAIGSYCGIAAPATLVEANPEALIAEPAPAATLLGKWLAVDMMMKPEPGQKLPKHEEMVEMIKKQNMVYDFNADGKVTITTEGRPATIAKYKKVGNKIETTDEAGNKTSMDIVKMTDKEMTLKLMDGKMTVVMQKM